MLREMTLTASTELRAGPLAIGPDRRIAYLGGEPIFLTHHELGLLIALMRRQDTVLGREELADAAWGRPLRRGDRSVDVYVRRLRQKLAAAAPDWTFIHTHFAFGYRFRAER
jgi:DNA-binding response OmpR family regulator